MITFFKILSFWLSIAFVIGGICIYRVKKRTGGKHGKESVFYEKRRKTKPFTDDKENDKKNVSGNTDGHDHLHIPYRM